MSIRISLELGFFFSRVVAFVIRGFVESIGFDLFGELVFLGGV